MRGEAILNAPMVSAVCHDDDLDMSLVTEGSRAIAEGGLLGAIEKGLSKLRFRGLAEGELAASMDGYALAVNLMDLKTQKQCCIGPLLSTSPGCRWSSIRCAGGLETARQGIATM